MIISVKAREGVALLALLALLLIASPVIAQTAQQMAALEARLMARLEQRMAEESEASRPIRKQRVSRSSRRFGQRRDQTMLLIAAP